MATTNNYDISVYQGDTFNISLIVKDSNGNRFNLSGYTGFAGIKSSYCSTGYLGTFNVSITNYGSGEVSVSMPATGTAELYSTIAFYDLEFASGSYVNKFLAGKVYIYPQISNSFP